MRIFVRCLAVFVAVALVPSSALAVSTVFGPDPLALYASNGPDGYMAKTNSGEEFFFIDASGEFLYVPADTFLPGIPADDTWLLTGIIEDGAVFDIAMTFLDFDDLTQQWNTGSGEANDSLGNLAFTVELDGPAQLTGDTVWANVFIDSAAGREGAELHFRVASQVPEPAAAVLFGVGLVLTHSATRRRAA